MKKLIIITGLLISSSLTFAADPTKTPYEALGINKNATKSQIKKAYYTQARNCHPDKKPGDSAAAEKFKTISAAWELLEDNEKRENYDKGNHPGNLQRFWAHPNGDDWGQAARQGATSYEEYFHSAFTSMAQDFFEILRDPEFKKGLEIMTKDQKLSDLIFATFLAASQPYDDQGNLRARSSDAQIEEPLKRPLDLLRDKLQMELILLEEMKGQRSTVGRATWNHYSIHTQEQVLAQLKLCTDKVEEIFSAKEKLKKIANDAAIKGKKVGARNLIRARKNAFNKELARIAKMKPSEKLAESSDYTLKCLSKIFKFFGM